MAILNNSNAISSGVAAYDINNSLRFRKSASAYLNRTNGTATNQSKGTWSFWVKRSQLGTQQRIFEGRTASSDTGVMSIEFTSGDLLDIGGWNYTWRRTTQVFRDPSAWYHIIIAVDTTQATAANRILVYVNGSQVTSFGTNNNPTQNDTFGLNNNAAALFISNSFYNTGWNIDGYLAETYFVDGQALTPSSFGETDTTTGSWKPKAYTGTYGTNGFYLKFSDIATTSGSNAGLGKDFSGNTNYWNTNNISVTTGTTYDAMIDSPTLTSATVGNYCVLNPFLKYSGLSAPTNGNLTIAGNNANWRSILSSFAVSSGKWYCEINMTSVSTDALVGIFNINTAADLNDLTTVDNRQIGRYSGGYSYQNNGNKVNNNTATAYGSTWTTGDVIGIALDMDAGTIVFYKNNTSQGTAYSSLSGLFAIGISTANGTFDPNFGQRPFVYTPPTGFVRLNTYNLPTPTILQGNKYMDATLYTGTGSALTVTNAGAFKPDLVWNKARSNAYNNVLTNSVSGTTKFLISNGTDAEQTEAQSVTSFNSNGFSLGTAGTWNQNAATYVAWQWQAGQGSTSSNTSGSITSTVSVNATAGFSIVTYTGNGTAGATIGHGLGVTPAMIIVKARSASGANYEWVVQHKSVPASQILLLSNTIAATTSPTFNSQYPSSSVIYLGSNTGANQSTITYVAYCWAAISGYSAFGNYTGNGNADGPFIYLGFRPKFIMWKRSDAVENWSIWTPLAGGNGIASSNSFYLLPNSSGAQDTYQVLDTLSNGFKIRDSGTFANASGGTYIYAAFASNPFRNSNAF